jgi:hypothetical protein
VAVALLLTATLLAAKAFKYAFFFFVGFLDRQLHEEVMQDYTKSTGNRAWNRTSMALFSLLFLLTGILDIVIASRFVTVQWR